MRKIIFFDADGTIVKNNVISETTKQTLKQLQAKGHILVLATGRALPSLVGPLKDLDLDHMICSGGATVVANKEVIYTRPMPLDQHVEVSKYLDQFPLFYNMEANDHVYTKKGQLAKLDEYFKMDQIHLLAPELQMQLQRIRNIILERTIEIEDISTIQVNKFHYYITQEDAKKILSFDQVKENLGQQYNCVQLSLSKLFAGGEINEKGITKQHGIDVLLKHFNLSLDDAYAIGDDYNDYEMLDYVPNAIAMGNAPDAIKALASHITSSVDEEGFTKAMYHYGLL